LHDSFKIQGLEGEHLCLVHEPLGVSLETFRNVMPAKQLPEALLKLSLNTYCKPSTVSTAMLR
jgi:hypothetical protein